MWNLLKAVLPSHFHSWFPVLSVDRIIHLFEILYPLNEALQYVSLLYLMLGFWKCFKWSRLQMLYIENSKKNFSIRMRAEASLNLVRDRLNLSLIGLVAIMTILLEPNLDLIKFSKFKLDLTIIAAHWARTQAQA